MRVAQNAVAECTDIQLASEAQPAAFSIVRILSPCLAGQIFRVRHAGVVFAGIISADGRGEIMTPLLDRNTEAVLELEDGRALTVVLSHQPGDFDHLFRIVLSWTASVELDLHLLEFPGEWGGRGHVWRGAPRSFAEVQAGGAGYLQRLPAPASGLPSHDVYTYWALQDVGAVVKVAVDHSTRGATAAAPYCGDERLAAPRYRLMRSERGKALPPQIRRIARAPCAATLSGVQRLATQPTDDLRISTAP